MSRSNLSTYPANLVSPSPISEIHDLITDERSESSYSLSGRVTSVREHGAMAFVDIADHTGTIQLFIRRNDSPPAHALVADLLVGDWLHATGQIGRTRRGESSLFVSELHLTSPCLTPMPDPHVGISDVERLRRERTLDLVLHEAQRETLVQRSRIIQAIRSQFLNDDFLEMDTPILQPIAGGASAEAFSTHYNALSEERYLRIAPEFYLERLIIAGFPRVFEFARNFRNEGMDATHSPEFTSLEWYCAHSTSENEMDRTERILQAASQVTGSNIFDDIERIALIDAWNLECDPFDEAALREDLTGRGISCVDMSHAQMLDTAWDDIVEPTLTGAVFIHTWPILLSPLARPLDENFASRWDIYVEGVELGCCYQELNNPDLQRELMGDAPDEAFLAAMELGMPPCSGVGIGIDRLVMLLCERTHIRDTIAFPDFRQLRS